MNDCLDLIFARRSSRLYQDRAVEEEKLHAVLKAALSAPSAHDSRPWHFTVLSSGAAKERLISALSSRLHRDLSAGRLSDEQIRAKIARSKQIFSSAPILIVFCTSAPLPANPLDPTGAIEKTLATQSTALAVGQLMLAAESVGLASCWFSAPLFCPTETAEALSLSLDQWVPEGLLTLGYRADTPKEKAPLSAGKSISYL